MVSFPNEMTLLSNCNGTATRSWTVSFPNEMTLLSNAIPSGVRPGKFRSPTK